jgi:hypothetical protein
MRQSARSATVSAGSAVAPVGKSSADRRQSGASRRAFIAVVNQSAPSAVESAVGTSVSGAVGAVGARSAQSAQSALISGQSAQSSASRRSRRSRQRPVGAVKGYRRRRHLISASRHPIPAPVSAVERESAPSRRESAQSARRNQCQSADRHQLTRSAQSAPVSAVGAERSA